MFGMMNGTVKHDDTENTFPKHKLKLNANTAPAYICITGGANWQILILVIDRWQKKYPTPYPHTFNTAFLKEIVDPFEIWNRDRRGLQKISRIMGEITSRTFQEQFNVNIKL